MDIGAPTAAAELASLGHNLAMMLERSDGKGKVVVCDVGGLTDPDAALLDALARLQLTARRLGCEVRLRNASDELHGLLALAGMCDIVGLCDPPAIGECPALWPRAATDSGAEAVRRAETSWPCRGRT